MTPDNQRPWRRVDAWPSVEWRAMGAYERKLWDAVAAGFALPYASVRGVVWPVFWRRAAARAGRVAGLFEPDSAEYRAGFFLWPAGPVPNWPWAFDEHGPSTDMMLRAAAKSQADTSPVARQQRGRWTYALACCELEFEDQLAAWVAPMREDWKDWIRTSLGEWPTERPEALLDYLAAEYARHGVLLG